MVERIKLIIGNCGVGKTWVMDSIIKNIKANKTGKIGMFFYHRNEDTMVLGKYDGSTFQGSDKLSMAIMRDIDLFLQHSKNYNVICEGDRFTNSTFITKAKPTIIKINGDGSEGREKRGSKQSEQHLKRISTRVRNINADLEFNNSNECYEYLIHSINTQNA